MLAGEGGEVVEPDGEVVTEIREQIAGHIEQVATILERLRAGEAEDPDLWDGLRKLGAQGERVALELEQESRPAVPPVEVQPQRRLVPVQVLNRQVATAITKALRSRWPREGEIRTTVDLAGVRSGRHVIVWCPAALESRVSAELDAAVAGAVGHPIVRQALEDSWVRTGMRRQVPAGRADRVRVTYRVLAPGLKVLTEPTRWH